VRNLIVNTQTRSVYSILDMPQTRTWLEADEECRQLGHEFRMLEIGNVGEFDATVPYVNQDIPLYQKRNASGAFVPAGGGKTTWFFWNTVQLNAGLGTQPQNTANYDCAYLSNPAMASYPCDARNFSRVICESKTASYYPWTHSR
jgi:hypothetical protein